MNELILCSSFKQYLDPCLTYMVYYVETETQNHLIIDFAESENEAQSKSEYYKRYYPDITYRLITEDDDF